MTTDTTGGTAAPMRVRVRFTKTGALRYVGHLDLQTIWERAARRASLPLAYSHGFHPQPKINFASALPLGFSSREEILDMRLQDAVDLRDLRNRLDAALPTGIGVIDVQQVDEAEPALQTRVEAAEYEATILDDTDPASLDRSIRRVLESVALPRMRRDRQYDLRPLIDELHVSRTPTGANGVVLFMRLSARESATGRPEEVLAELGIPVELARIERLRLIFRGQQVESGA